MDCVRMRATVVHKKPPSRYIKLHQGLLMQIVPSGTDKDPCVQTCVKRVFQSGMWSKTTFGPSEVHGLGMPSCKLCTSA